VSAVALGVKRHSAYTSDVSAARALAASGQFTMAASKFDTAIGEWPLNSDATNGLAAAKASLAALTLKALENADTSMVRQNMYNARQANRVQFAAQADATAIAGSH
jgi:hypothetical protein